MRSPSLAALSSQIFDPRDLDRTYAGPDRSRRTIPLLHESARPLASFNSTTGKKCLDFRVDSLCKKLQRTSAQDIGQWIIDLLGLTTRGQYC
ncbi:hypothetical protein J2R76_003918 [Bradyrhizobium sp. USDA 4532]|uniref:hypothetical protein n=1 Tax=unclassified Bradyrhizobium TaxID=2631580 RepID=UPI0020A10EAA|nr:MULTISPECIES: hypothetical protein [unclassified Bradyrhizobium]MCP1835578.1 hypothetical protein [Bradyrhizobium sp. USDA 4545]MCP1920327.1 hypothetical protein [Bradyrhizobium sp. USDA 4532]